MGPPGAFGLPGGNLRRMSSAPSLAQVVSTLERFYDPAWAESWDAVGLVCGDPESPVRRILFAVDPVEAVVTEALDWRADLVVVHHPLLLRPVHGVPATNHKGRLVHRLIGAGAALYTAHTSADSADPGVSDALAAAVGLQVLAPLVPAGDDPAGRRGIGRVCRLPRPERLEEFVRRVGAGLPATAAGLRVAGDPQAMVETVAVCGGAGDSYFGAARAAGVDVYLTADLRHHPASEAREAGPPALIDAAHWATEWPWLTQAAERLTAELAGAGTTVETCISRLVTDPWTIHASTPGA
jgi:dinuclear metal center YbgI/SA1388 family protein